MSIIECLRLKIVERLLKQGSSADEPINIQLSDYSSDEGSNSSDIEGRDCTKDISDLEGPCCQPLRVPPCSPELNVEVRKLRYGRMRKIMQELDRIYFQPVFRKKFHLFVKTKCSTIMKKRKRILSKKAKNLYSDSQTINDDPQTLNKSSEVNTITLQYVEVGLNSNSGKSESSTSVNTLKPQENEKIKKRKKRLKRGKNLDKEAALVKISRKLRLWLRKRQIFIVRRKLRHKFKFRLKTLHRRKKDERLLLDMPTTDPGSDLLFSTDDEYIDANGIVTCYSTMPPRIRCQLLKSELQRRYIEEIGDGLKNMPPELIITSPSNKGNEKNHSVRILYKPAGAEKYERKSQTTNELPFIGQPAQRTRSWHNLNTTAHTSSLSPYKLSAAKNKPLSKNKILSKEDLDIKLSLKKKIWTGIQADDILLDIDRTRPLSWVAPHTLKSKKMTAVENYRIDLSNDVKKLENEAFLSACSRKLMEWQMMNTIPDTSQCSQKSKIPLKLVVPDINQDRAIYIFKHLTNIKAPCPTKFTAKPKNEITTEEKTERSTNISKVVEAGRILTKLSKVKARNMSTSHRAASKLALNQHKSHIPSNKFKTGGIVVTTVQTAASGGATGCVKKNKKLKSLHHKLPNINSCNTLYTECGGSRRLSAHNNKNNSNNKGSLVMAATATAIVRKVKTKLKRKKLSSNSKPETTINLNELNNNSYDTIIVPHLNK